MYYPPLKTSQFNLTTAIQHLQQSAFGILLLEEDKSGTLHYLAQRYSHKEKIILNGNRTRIPCHLYALNKQAPSNPNLPTPRTRAEQILFQRWTAAGFNSNNASHPSNSPHFQTYLENIGWPTADYLLLLDT